MRGLISVFVSLTLWISWYARLARGFNPRLAGHYRLALGILPIAGSLIVLPAALVFHFPGDAEPLDRVGWTLTIFLVSTRGLYWVLPGLGLDPIRDIVERQNQAVLAPLGAAIAGPIILIAASLQRDWSQPERLLELTFALAAWMASAFVIDSASRTLARVTGDRESAAGFAFAIPWLSLAVPLARILNASGNSLETDLLRSGIWLAHLGVQLLLLRVLQPQPASSWTLGRVAVLFLGSVSWAVLPVLSPTALQ